MIHRKNVAEIISQAKLLSGNKYNVSRALRRFLKNFDITSGAGNTRIAQIFAQDEGYSTTQFEAIRWYAIALDVEQQELFSSQSVQCLGTVVDVSAQRISNDYVLPFTIESATLPQLHAAFTLVWFLASRLRPFSHSPAVTCCFSDYNYRGLSCSIVPQSQLWMISGFDKRNGGSGVLEWCVDKDDAQLRLGFMQRYPDRFIDVTATPYPSA